MNLIIFSAELLFPEFIVPVSRVQYFTVSKYYMTLVILFLLNAASTYNSLNMYDERKRESC